MGYNKTVVIDKLEVKGTETHFEIHEAFDGLYLGVRKFKKNSLDFVDWIRSELALGTVFEVSLSSNLAPIVEEAISIAHVINEETRRLRLLAEDKLMEFEDK